MQDLSSPVSEAVSVSRLSKGEESPRWTKPVISSSEWRCWLLLVIIFWRKTDCSSPLFISRDVKMIVVNKM